LVFPPTLPSPFCDLVFLLLDAIKECLARNTLPTIALKSGCVLLLDPSKSAHKRFVSTLALEVRPKSAQSIVITAGRPETLETKRLVVKLPSSVSEICSEAALLFRADGMGKHIQFVRATDAALEVDLTEVKSDLRDRRINFVTLGENAQDYVVPLQEEKKQIVYFDDLIEYVSPEWRNDSRKATEQNKPGIPFAWILDKWQLVKDRLAMAKQKNLEGEYKKIRGTHSALIALKV